MNTQQLQIENQRVEPAALIACAGAREEALRAEIAKLMSQVISLEKRLESLPGLGDQNAFVARVTELHNQNEFMSNLLSMFIKAVQWPKVTSKMVGEWSGTVRSIGSRGKKLLMFLEKFELAVRDLEKYQAALTKNGAKGGVNES